MQSFDNAIKLDSTKIALITGAAGLLGYQHAAALLEMETHVVLTDINIDSLYECREQLLEEFSNARITCVQMDVTSESSIKECADYLNKNDQIPTIIINNAAIDAKVLSTENEQTSGSALDLFSVDSWDKELNVGLRGAFLVSRIFGSMMIKENKTGCIINIASDLSIIAPDQRIYSDMTDSGGGQYFKPVTYSVIKAGLVGLTRYIASYWAQQGIRCNALSPGGVYNNQDKNFVTKLVDLIPLGRMAMASEYRSAIKFLASDASSYMTGHNLVMDGGRSII